MNHESGRLLLVAFVAAALGCAGSGVAPTETPAAADSDVVARVGDQAFTMEDIDARARQLDANTYQALFDARKRALEIMLGDHLLDTEAQARGITREELIEQEVNQKMLRPSVEQITAYYEENPDKMRGGSLADMSSQISNHLATQSRNELVQALMASLRQKNPVSVSLEPPRVPVTIAENDPTKGPAGAPVQILEFSDFQ